MGGEGKEDNGKRRDEPAEHQQPFSVILRCDPGRRAGGASKDERPGPSPFEARRFAPSTSG